MNTVRALLLGSDQPGSGRGNDLAERLRGSAFTGPLRALSPAGRTLVDRSLGSVAGRLLDLDLVDLLMAGWRKHTALAEAA
ncbi:MAG TPA: hypothetical protein VFE14_18535, partial [Micromonosporaceae bacterium]|nr:hypothetical protein [Micromonosporaceae bacterium]